MTAGRYNLVVYLGSGQEGRSRRLRLEREARSHGYVKKGKVKLAPYIIDKLEDKLAKKDPTDN